MHNKIFDRFMQENGHNNIIISKLLSQESWNMLKARMERKVGKIKWGQTCRHCDNPEAILSKETCCTVCSKVKMDEDVHKGQA